MAIRTDEDVEKLVAAGGMPAFRNLVESPTALHPADRAYAFNWLRRQEAAGAIAREDEAHEFMRRQTDAAERAAKAAEASAQWARIGAWIAIGALVATAWPYFKLLDVVERLAK